jgi:hypothetical protein
MFQPMWSISGVKKLWMRKLLSSVSLLGLLIYMYSPFTAHVYSRLWVVSLPVCYVACLVFKRTCNVVTVRQGSFSL